MTVVTVMRRRPGIHTTIAGTVLTVGLVYGYQSVREGIGTVGQTGAGFFPLLVALVLVASSAVVLLEERRGEAGHRSDVGQAENADDGSDEAGGIHWWRVLGVLGASLSVPLLAETIGFVVTLSAAVAVIAKIMGMPGVLKPSALGIGFGAAAWLVFVYWLFVPLPAGALGLA